MSFIISCFIHRLGDQVHVAVHKWNPVSKPNLLSCYEFIFVHRLKLLKH